MHFHNVHHLDKCPELTLGKDAIRVLVDLLEEICELVQESLVLLQLEVQDELPEVLVPQS